MSKTSQYLYGLDATEFIDMTYVRALQYKIKSANTLNRKLSEVHYSDRDYDRSLDIDKAIKHNQMLLDELK